MCSNCSTNTERTQNVISQKKQQEKKKKNLWEEMNRGKGNILEKREETGLQRLSNIA